MNRVLPALLRTRVLAFRTASGSSKLRRCVENIVSGIFASVHSVWVLLVLVIEDMVEAEPMTCFVDGCISQIVGTFFRDSFLYSAELG